MSKYHKILISLILCSAILFPTSAYASSGDDHSRSNNGFFSSVSTMFSSYFGNSNDKGNNKDKDNNHYDDDKNKNDFWDWLTGKDKWSDKDEWGDHKGDSRSNWWYYYCY
ncbi:hypothetical protein [Paenibacillus harenae]|uniref:Uncharacterized protein n=1 Tax=Paenibacillus harenae TaxID=306543 RepID=A0ABT9U755_PAEHA|nr:hypothetical protein [Paenibacillus harenae]MDQ0063365.1 hypothetical protein [Paenibacillus harenae]MDQ0114848.1 hypothetical protein [Paenibacillus harenae]